MIFNIDFFLSVFLLFIEMDDWIDIKLFICHPISIKHKYEVFNQETISFD